MANARAFSSSVPDRSRQLVVYCTSVTLAMPSAFNVVFPNPYCVAKHGYDFRHVDAAP
jgi:hypothetical protein